MALILIENLCFKFNDEYTLRDISVKIEQGEKIAVLGDNGSGKTTFFLCLNGVYQGNSGRFIIGGKEEKGKKLGAKLRGLTAMVFQDADCQIVAPTVFSEVAFGPSNMALEKEEILKRTQKAIEEMNLRHLEDRPPHYLSGGEKKRVTIADVLAMEPEIFLMDEPTSGLDIKNTHAFEESISNLEKKGKTIIISTHDVDFALKWAEKIWVFNAGQILAQGTPEEIFNNQELLLKAGLKVPTAIKIMKDLGLKVAVRDIEGLTKVLKEIANG